MSKPKHYMQYFCSNASNPNAIKTVSRISRKMLAANLRVARRSGRWHISRYVDGAYVMSSKNERSGAKWVLTIEPEDL